MKEQFRHKKISEPRLRLLEKAIGIITEYQKQGIKMTLRQLYYQLVARDVIKNLVSEYKKLGTLLKDARYNGIVDWDAIEDRIRVPSIPSQWNDVLGLIRSAKTAYRLPRWKDQEYYVELFTEKDALSSVLEPIANKLHISFCVNRGYTSASAIYELSKRVMDKIEDDKKVVVLYLGDYDPSGLDMVRDIKDRLKELLEEGETTIHDFDEWVEVVPVALTREQIDKYNPPPNPAKLSDTRAKAYVAKYGSSSWEVDALRPEIMIKIVEDSIAQFLDTKKYNEVMRQEEKDMEQLEEFAKKLKRGEGK